MLESMRMKKWGDASKTRFHGNPHFLEEVQTDKSNSRK